MQSVAVTGDSKMAIRSAFVVFVIQQPPAAESKFSPMIKCDLSSRKYFFPDLVN
jgi:hypothetical protein